jgi:hypothetical protein
MGLQPALLAGHIVLRRAIFVVGYHYLRGLLRVLAVFVNQIHQLLVFGDCARRGSTAVITAWRHRFGFYTLSKKKRCVQFHLAQLIQALWRCRRFFVQSAYEISGLGCRRANQYLEQWR